MSKHTKEPAAYMFPSDLEKFNTDETFAQTFSIPVGRPDEQTVPLYSAEQLHAVEQQRDELLEALKAVRDGKDNPCYIADKAIKNAEGGK